MACVSGDGSGCPAAARTLSGLTLTGIFVGDGTRLNAIIGAWADHIISGTCGQNALSP